MKAIGKILKTLEIGEVTEHRNLAVFPLGSDEDGRLDYLTLAEALARRLARVAEVSDSGSVPELLLENRAELPVLIVDGEELVGAKQNRVANLTVLAPPQKSIVIPVSCVEAGRWRHTRDDFAAAGRAHYAAGRAAKARSVSASLRSSGSRHSDQGRVWQSIAEKAQRMEAPSPTQAMAAVFERHHASVEDYVAAIRPAEHQLGALFAIDGHVVGLDLFDRHATLEALLPMLVRSYAIDALETVRSNGKAPTGDEAAAFLTRTAEAPVESYPAVGLGTDIRLSAPGLTAGGLVVDDSLVHLAAFAVTEADSSPHPGRGMASLSARRRARRG